MRCRMTVPYLLMFALFLLLAAGAAQAQGACQSDPCVNGRCVDTADGGFVCQCNPGWSGTLCDIPTSSDPCLPNPCANGACQNAGGTAVCQCNPGWTGSLCDVNIDECASDPCVNGVCIDQVNGYRCGCMPGWTGNLCDVNIDECESDPCVHGQCTDLVNGYSCSCQPGYTGPNCDVPVVTLDCSGAVASPGQLWPPNHQLVPIQVLDVTDPSNGLVTITFTSVFQDEPVHGTGSGDTGPDAFGVGTSNLTVRSERAGNGDGRVYHIAFSATSTSGGSCTGNVTVGVPKSQGKNGGPVDGGALYNSTLP